MTKNNLESLAFITIIITLIIITICVVVATKKAFKPKELKLSMILSENEIREMDSILEHMIKNPVSFTPRQNSDYKRGNDSAPTPTTNN